MKLEWDPEKNLTNVKKHGLDFSLGEELFKGPMFFREDRGGNYGEPRFIGIGVAAKNIILVCYTNQGPETIRVISMRQATSSERRMFMRFLEGMVR